MAVPRGFGHSHKLVDHLHSVSILVGPCVKRGGLASSVIRWDERRRIDHGIGPALGELHHLLTGNRAFRGQSKRELDTGDGAVIVKRDRGGTVPIPFAVIQLSSLRRRPLVAPTYRVSGGSNSDSMRTIHVSSFLNRSLPATRTALAVSRQSRSRERTDPLGFVERKASQLFHRFAR